MKPHYLKNPPNRSLREIYAWIDSSVSSYPPHYHDHAEIIYIAEGPVIVDLDYKKITLFAGDALLLFPNQIHLFSEPQGKSQTYVFIFKVSTCPNYKQILETKRPELPVIRNAAEIPNVKMLMQLMLEESAGHDKYADQIVAGALQTLLGLLVRECTLVNRGNLDETTAMRILGYCHAHFSEDINLTNTAEALGLSPYYLSHLIPKKYGMHFGELIALLRIEEALRLIKDGCKISSAALYAGFPSVRAFNRAFQKQYGKSPSEYLGFK